MVVEEWHAELWLDDADSVTLYRRVWDTLAQSVLYGTDAQHVISRALRAVPPPTAQAGDRL
ncbi:hypothetical protein ABZ835_46885 [Streptomyces sp. NPDC047461]|uniref:hypothetical protein n=1 Tax=Streptomyces sp. NPDC047461 TaxID=3155619 RepID=UPI0033D81241